VIFRTVSLDGTNLFILVSIIWRVCAPSDKIQVTVEFRASNSWRLSSVYVHIPDIRKQRTFFIMFLVCSFTEENKSEKFFSKSEHADSPHTIFAGFNRLLYWFLTFISYRHKLSVSPVYVNDTKNLPFDDYRGSFRRSIARSSAEIKNAWSHTSNNSDVFMREQEQLQLLQACCCRSDDARVIKIVKDILLHTVQ
jgi:hypothetical protein